MKKIIEINGEHVELQTNALVPILYKKNFQKDFFAEMANLQELGFEFLYEMTWIFARIAHPEIPDFEEWLSQFETFPILDIKEDIIALILACMQQKNAQTVTAKRKKAPAKK